MSNESRELAPDMFTLWLEDFIRSRASGKDVDTASIEADAAIREIRARKGEPEKKEQAKLIGDRYRWDGKVLVVRADGIWELAASIRDSGEWYTYLPSRQGSHIGTSGKVAMKAGGSCEALLDPAKNAAMRALDWEAYGLHRPEGL